MKNIILIIVLLSVTNCFSQYCTSFTDAKVCALKENKLIFIAYQITLNGVYKSKYKDAKECITSEILKKYVCLVKSLNLVDGAKNNNNENYLEIIDFNNVIVLKMTIRNKIAYIKFTKK